MSMECEKKKAPIGVFDSGVGGLTVVREITRQLPHENIVYFGDTARVPYGSKSKSNIIRFSEQIIRFLKTKQVKAIVIACNTASALALDAVRDEFDIPIIGVIVPGARAAVEATANGEIGVVGNSFGDLMYEGFEEYLSGKGQKTVYKSPAETTVAAQVQMLDELITQKVASITISTNGDAGYDEVFKKAKEAGIPIVSVDSEASQDYRVCHVNQAETADIGSYLVQAAVLNTWGVD